MSRRLPGRSSASSVSENAGAMARDQHLNRMPHSPWMCAVQDSFKHRTAARRRIDYPIRFPVRMSSRDDREFPLQRRVQDDSLAGAGPMIEAAAPAGHRAFDD